MKRIQFAYDDDIPDICQDAVFKALMTKETPPSRGARDRLLSAILDRPVKVMNINPNEPPISGIQDRQIRFDLNLRLADGELVNAEMTKDPTPDEVLRMEYYAARLHTGQEIRGTLLDYRDLKKTWQISLLSNRNLFPDEALIHRFTYYDRKHDIELGGRTEIVTVELKKADAAVERRGLAAVCSAELWSYFFRHLKDKNKRHIINEILAMEEGIAMAGEVVQGFTKHELELFHQISKDKWQIDMQRRFNYAREEARETGLKEGREAGLKEGLEEGLKEGLKEGLETGLEAGRAEGLAEGRAETVKMMRKHGMSPEQIAETLELPPDIVSGYLKAD
ncbi:MAG: Rpn family recombination-promoting nuclease/putative transposase [Treponema sp.]|jgi:predicted transposase/invertase (TIGR01784 family)|nr:Rpn family recombination-promoting nuclease/putative transposase [Treponema sp.]